MWKRILLIAIALVAIAFLAKVAYGIATAPPLGAHFPQRIRVPSVGLDGIVEGELMLVNGCLRVSKVSDGSVLLIWDPRFSTRTEQGVIQVIDSNTGEVFASVGDYIKVGGGSFPKGVWLKQPIPKECPGPYWAIGDPPWRVERP
ncbi:MAG: hypothetical protein C3F07_10945 [Anaerolineales bacterium]|nr:hypothetical protein [Anaerolineae bacterium]PWB72814.1 MAG: hypothetical protein C3F07_10945 [Anaerolineales bacterium]